MLTTHLLSVPTLPIKHVAVSATVCTPTISQYETRQLLKLAASEEIKYNSCIDITPTQLLHHVHEDPKHMDIQSDPKVHNR